MGTCSLTTVRPFLALAAAPLLGPALVGLPPSVATSGSADDSTARVATAAPHVSFVRTIRTTPFVGTSTSMLDNEGTAYVRRDRTLWLVDDSGGGIYGVNPTTGVLKRVVNADALSAVRRFGGKRRAGRARSEDLESLAYDAANDRLYAFSGTNRSRPTAFRFERVGGRLVPSSYQPLPRTSDPTAAAWSSRTKQLYVGSMSHVRRYSYAKTRYGPPLRLPGVADLYGLDFTDNGRFLLAAHDGVEVSKFRWRGRSRLWTVGLGHSGVRDARGVEQIGRRLFVADGLDVRRRPGSRLKFAVFVFRL